MKTVGFIIAACVVLSVIQSATVAAVIVFGTLLLRGVLFRPRHVLGLLTFGLVVDLLQRHPIAWAAIAFLLLAGVIAGSVRRADE